MDLHCMGVFTALQVPCGLTESWYGTPHSPFQQSTMRAACPVLQPAAFWSHFASTKGDESPQHTEMWPQSIPRSITYHHWLFRKQTFFQQEHSTASLPCSHRNEHQERDSWRSHQTHLPMHTLVSHHLTILCFLLLATTIFLRLFAKGLLFLLIVQREPEAKCVNGKGGGKRSKWSLVVHNSPLSLAVWGSLLSSFHLWKPGCLPQHNIATGKREEEGLTFIYFSAIIRIMSGGKSINT